MTIAMEREMETAQTVRETKEPAENDLPLEVQNRRLQALVTELIRNNQELRFKAAQLQTELEQNQRALAAMPWAGMLF